MTPNFDAPAREDEAATSDPAERRRPGTGLLLLALPAAMLVIGFFVVPMARLGWQSVTVPTVGVDNYLGLFTDGVTSAVILRTLRLVAIVTLVCLLVAYPYAYLMTVAGRKTRAILTALVLMPFWTSLMARNFAWIVLLQDGGPVTELLRVLGFGHVTLLGTTTGVTIAMAQVMLPFMVLPLYTTLRGIDRGLIDAALSLGARPATVFFRVYLPLSRPGILAGVTLVAILTLGFYITPALVGSPQQSMVGQLIASRVQQVLDFGGAGALSFVLLAVALLILALIGRVVRPGRIIGATEVER